MRWSILILVAFTLSQGNVAWVVNKHYHQTLSLLHLHSRKHTCRMNSIMLSRLPLRGHGQYQLKPVYSRMQFRIKNTAKSFGNAVRDEAELLQIWLENLYEAVDYEAALERAGIDFDSEFDRADEELGVTINDKQGESSTWTENGNEEAGQCEGKEGELTYGEMDLSFFVALLRRLNPARGARFVDLGSGRGQLVLAAAKMYPWDLCTGIEIMPEVYEIGQGALAVARASQANISRCEFFKADIYNFTQPLARADVVFAYATCFPTSDGRTLARLSRVLADNLRDGATVITVNKRSARPRRRRSPPRACGGGLVRASLFGAERSPEPGVAAPSPARPRGPRRRLPPRL